MKDEIEAELARKKIQFTRIKGEIITKEGLARLLPFEEQILQNNRNIINEIMYTIGILQEVLKKVKVY